MNGDLGALFVVLGVAAVLGVVLGIQVAAGRANRRCQQCRMDQIMADRMIRREEQRLSSRGEVATQVFMPVLPPPEAEIDLEYEWRRACTS